METLVEPSANLLRQAQLLAGLGAKRDLSAQLLAAVRSLDNRKEEDKQKSEPQRSCISAGNSLMLSLLAPGGRSLRIAQRLEGTQRWMHTHYDGAGSEPEKWRTEFFLASKFSAEQSPWPKTLDFARRIQAEEKAKHYHARLGAKGRLLSYAERIDAATPGGWITWQLDRHYSPAAALSDCGASWAWPVAAQYFQTLFGRSLSKYARPWSLAVEISGAQPRFRLGTTVWARQAESVEKHRRLAATVAQLGGDSCFAEGLYKLVAAGHSPGFAHRIGRAAEIEFVGDRAASMEFFLCVTTP